MSYFIKQGYIENSGPLYFLDDPKEDDQGGGLVTFQPDVYTLAKLIAQLEGWVQSEGSGHRDADILDIGCGWGEKLAAMRDSDEDGWFYIGMDYGKNIQHCRDTYDWGARGKWLDVDLETVTELPSAHVAICSDVIEHLVDPIPLLKALKAGDFGYIIISTPERDVQYGYDHMGPSKNLCHVREWNAQELHTFLTSEGLTVDHIGLTRGNDQSFSMGTILAVCH